MSDYTKYKATIGLSKLDKRAIYEIHGEKYITLEIYINNELDQHGNIGSSKLNFKDGDAWERIKVGNVKPDIKKGSAPVSAPAPSSAEWDSDDSIPF